MSKLSMPLYSPHDPYPYPRDARSRLADGTLADGLYAYVQDAGGNVWILPDQPHIHPKILGGGSSASYAGDLRIEAGEVADVTNLSGTFQCDDPSGLLAAADQMIQQGLTIRPGAIRFFPADGSPPRVLR
jgi:hypothetical protein